MKLNILMDDIKKKEFFDPTNAGTNLPSLPLKLILPTLHYTHKNTSIFFRCLHNRISKTWPAHAHIIIWLAKQALWNATMIDTFISAQLPDHTIDPIGYDAVSSFMIHGPCGTLRTYSPCMSEGKCSNSTQRNFVSKPPSLKMVLPSMPDLTMD
jgi:hypothetical protein